MIDRSRFSSAEEQLHEIKKLCVGYGIVIVSLDHNSKLWKAEAPIRLDDNFNISTIGVGIDPGIAIGDLWNKLLCATTIKLTYPQKPTKFVRWENNQFRVF